MENFNKNWLAILLIVLVFFMLGFLTGRITGHRSGTGRMMKERIFKQKTGGHIEIEDEDQQGNDEDGRPLAAGRGRFTARDRPDE